MKTKTDSNETETETQTPAPETVTPQTETPAPADKPDAEAKANGEIKGRILLRKHHDITPFASTDASRFVLNGVHYNPECKCLEATDGKMLIRVPVDVDSAKEYPPLPKLDSLPLTRSEAIIPTKLFKKALANIPASKLPILESSRLDIEPAVTHPETKDKAGRTIPASTDPTIFHLTSNDLDAVTTISGRSIDGNYPKIDQVIPTTKPTLTIMLAAHLVHRIAEFARKHGEKDEMTGITFELVDEVSPVKFSITLKGDGKQAIGVMMPMRLT